MPDQSDAADSSQSVPGDSTKRPSFDPRVLDRTVIARPLIDELKQKGEDVLIDVVIDLNTNYPGGRDRARERVRDLASAALASTCARRS
jgi:hypothetical protein